MSINKPSSTDVARLAGVSQSAVSRTFTPGGSVSEATRDKVLAAAQDLGYRPNALARSLITGRSRIIGLVVAYLDNLFYPTALEMLSRALQARGYHILMFMAPQTAANADEVLDEILNYQADGIILASASMSSSLAARCDDAGVPVVLFNRAQDDHRFSAVVGDNVGGGRKLAEFLLAGGHTRIGYIAGWEGASTQRDREAGFIRGLEERGVTLFAREVGNYNFADACNAARRMFQKSERPDALFVANDHMAIAVMDVLRNEFDLSVPEAVSIVGYDDVPQASWPTYDLTTVRQPAMAMVDAVVETLMARIERGDAEPHRIVLDAPLIVRSSARLPKGDRP